MLRKCTAGKVFLEHRVRCQPLFFQEPDEQQPRNQPDDVPLRGAVPGSIVREAAFCDRALEPAEQFAVETPVQFLDVEGAFPCSVQVVEAVHARGGDQPGQRECGKDVGVRPMRSPVGADAFDERDFLQHVPVRVPFVDAAVNHGERHRRPVPEQEDDGHAEQAIDGAGGVGQVRAVVVVAFQIHGQEQERFDHAGREPFALEQACLVGDFLARDLKHDIDGAPGIEHRTLLFGQPLSRPKRVEKCRDAAHVRGSRASVAQYPEQGLRTGAQRDARGETGQGGMDCFIHGAGERLPGR